MAGLDGGQRRVGDTSLGTMLGTRSRNQGSVTEKLRTETDCLLTLSNHHIICGLKSRYFYIFAPWVLRISIQFWQNFRVNRSQSSKAEKYNFVLLQLFSPGSARPRGHFPDKYLSRPKYKFCVRPAVVMRATVQTSEVQDLGVTARMRRQTDL